MHIWYNKSQFAGFYYCTGELALTFCVDVVKKSITGIVSNCRICPGALP